MGATFHFHVSLKNILKLLNSQGSCQKAVIQCFLSMSRAIDSVTSALYHGEVHVSRAALKTLAQLLS